MPSKHHLFLRVMVLQKRAGGSELCRLSYTVTLPQMAGAGAMALLVSFGSGVVSRHNLRRNEANGASKGMDGMGIAALPFEQPFRDGITDSSTRSMFRRRPGILRFRKDSTSRLGRINDSLRSCRLNVAEQSGRFRQQAVDNFHIRRGSAVSRRCAANEIALAMPRPPQSGASLKRSSIAAVLAVAGLAVSRLRPLLRISGNHSKCHLRVPSISGIRMAQSA